MKKNLAQISFILGISLLAFIFLVVSLSSIAFLAHGVVSVAWPIISLLVSGGFLFYLLVKWEISRPYIWLAVFFIILLGSLVFSSLTVDPSWDGNTYHKTAVGEMAMGWNPVYHSVNTFNKSTANPFKLIGVHGLDRKLDAPWDDHYPKATWIFSANIYKLTGNIESGKMITPLIIIDVFLFAFSLFYKRFTRNQALILSLLLALNPIVVTQIYSFYVDGIMGNLLIILMIACTMLFLEESRKMYSRLIYATIIMSTVLAVNVKFTGLVYVAIILACYGVYTFFELGRAAFIRFALICTASVLFALLIVGASSYVKNIYTNGNPLYPLAGKGSVNFITVEQPVGYAHMSYIERFIKSNLAATSQIDYQSSLQVGPPTVKAPFSVSPSELQTLASTDARQGGYGVWFGGILIISFLITVYLLARYDWRERRNAILFLIPAVAVGIDIIGVNATWYARYLPQLPIIPIIIVAALYLSKKTILPNILVFAILFNVTLTAMIGINAQIAFARVIHQNFQSNLTCNNESAPKVYSPINFDGALYNIYDACHKVQLLTSQKFSKVPSKDVAPLFESIDIIK